MIDIDLYKQQSFSQSVQQLHTFDVMLSESRGNQMLAISESNSSLSFALLSEGKILQAGQFAKPNDAMRLAATMSAISYMIENIKAT